MQKRITWKVEKRKLADLKPHPKNPRQFTEKGMKDLENSINSIGFMQPININQDGLILSGHARAMKLKEMGEIEVDVYVPDRMLTPKQEEEVLVRANANTAGQWDWDLLANNFELEDINEWGLEVPDMNITTEELEAKEDDFDGEPPAEPITVLGDLYEIGEHRLLCGDSTCSDTVAKLMDGKKADMVFTDPPYGIDCSGKGIKGMATENNFGKILNDKDVSIAIDNFNLISNLYPDATLIYWGANYYPQCFPSGFGWLFWDKEREGNTFSGGEIAFVNKGVRFDIFRHKWHGMIKASEMGEKRVHPTQKPIELVKFCFNNYNAGNIIADFFLGSGSTMVASHQLKRKCYGMELDPKYCDVIIRRMIKLDPNLKITRNGEDCKQEFIEKND